MSNHWEEDHVFTVHDRAKPSADLLSTRQTLKPQAIGQQTPRADTVEKRRPSPPNKSGHGFKNSMYPRVSEPRVIKKNRKAQDDVMRKYKISHKSSAHRVGKREKCCLLKPDSVTPQGVHGLLLSSESEEQRTGTLYEYVGSRSI